MIGKLAKGSYSRKLLGIALVAVLGLMPLGAVSASQIATAPKAPAPQSLPDIYTGADKLMSVLAEQLRTATPDQRFDVIVQFTGPSTPAMYDSVARAAGPITYTAQWDDALHGFAATLTSAQISALQPETYIKQIDLDLDMQADLDTSTYFTGAQQGRIDFGVDGSRGQPCCGPRNVVVAVIDTGIDAAHVDLKGTVIGWNDLVLNKPSPYDDQGHGTHVSGIIAGRGMGNPTLRGNAPGAALVGVKVLDSTGHAPSSRVISGINWMVSVQTKYSIRIANMSLGSPGCADGTDAVSTAVNNANTAGILMVVSAGNSGPGTCTIGAPAAAAGAFTVGATADPGFSASKGGYYLAGFSSRGPTFDKRTKPDIAAPGVNIRSSKANSINQYVAMSGTSMASPQVAGIAALMVAKNSALDNPHIKSWLQTTASDWGPSGIDSEWGAGLVNGHDAVMKGASLNGPVFNNGVLHNAFAGNVTAPNAQLWSINVVSTARPIGATLIMQGCACNFDLYLYGPANNLVASSTGANRQEQISFLPSVTGTYTLKVTAVTGSGTYQLDVSHS